MLIGFPLLDPLLLANDFSESNFIGLINPETGEKNIIPIQNDCASFQALFTDGLDGVVCPAYTFMSLRVFRDNGIKTYKAESVYLDENVKLFSCGHIKPYSIDNMTASTACAGGCNTCISKKNCN